MTTLGKRIAEAIKGTREYQAAVAFGVPDDAHDECATGIARAVVAVLPKSDVSDEAIWAELALGRMTDDEVDAHGLAAVRGLLDAQAAAHAADVNGLSELISAREVVHRRHLDRAEKAEIEVEALRAEVERKSLALMVNTEALGRVCEKLETAEADRDAYRARIDKVRALCDEYEKDAEYGGATEVQRKMSLDAAIQFRAALETK